MKVLHILFEDINFDPRVKKEIAALLKNGIQCELLYLTIKNDNYEEVNTYPVVFTTSKNTPRIFSWGVKTIKLFFEIKKRINANYDVLHVHNFFAGLMVSFFRLKNKTFILDAHEMYSEMVHRYLIVKILVNIFEKRIFTKADIIIHANKFRMEHLKNKYNLKNSNYYIHNYVSSAWTQNHLKKVPYFEELKKKGKKIVLYQGGISTGRYLKKIVQYFKTNNENKILVLIGDGELKDELSGYIEEHNLNKHIILYGKVKYDDLPSYTQYADLGIVTYENTCLNNYYCAPNKIFEYTSLGIPIIGIAFPPIKEILEKHNIGILFEEKDLYRFGLIIDNFFKSKKYNNSKNNTNTIASIYSWENEEKRLLNIYKAINKDRNL